MRPLLLVLVFSMSGCFFGGVPSQASCDGRPKGIQVCDDLTTNRNNQFAVTLMSLCIGTFSTHLCDHTGSLGGCLCESCENGRSITWLFTDADAGITTAADVMAKCTAENHPYQTP